MAKKILVGVPGVFHAPHLMNALLSSGYDAEFYTTLPARRFKSIPTQRIKSRIFPELIFRAATYLGIENWGDNFKMKYFGRWFGKQAKAVRPDATINWSSFGIEAIGATPHARHVIVRDSAHILFQIEVLKPAFKKLGKTFPDRSFCVSRELEEYRLADVIVVPSEFAKRTFVERSIAADKVFVLPLSADLKVFTAQERKPAELPLRIVYFGNITIQKGVPFLLEATKDFSPDEIVLELIGTVGPEMKGVLSRYSHFKTRPAMSQSDLNEALRNQDVFVFPSLHDGFGMVVPQAMATGVVPIVSDQCGASEMVVHEKNGFVLPAGNAEAIRSCLKDLIARPEKIESLRAEAIQSARRNSFAVYDQKVSELLKALW